MNAPERRIDNLYAFQGNALAVVELNELRTKPVAFSKLALTYRHFLVIHLAAQLLRFLLIRLPLGKGSHSVAVDGSLANDRNILTAIGIDERRIVVEESSLPTGINDRIVLLFWRKLQGSSLLQFQTDIACQYDRSLNIIGTRRHHNLGTLHHRSLLDGFGKGCTAIGLSIVPGSEILDLQ